MTLTIGVDVGGTKIAAGLVDDEGRILRGVRVPTPALNRTELLRTIVTAIHDCQREATAAAVGIAAAGFVDSERGYVLLAPNLNWHDEPLKAEIEARCGLSTRIENDANAAAWAEYKFGAGRESDTVFVTLGTGVGGGIIQAGQLLRGRHGIAAEIGHIRVVPNGRKCGCGSLGCLEQYASGPALVRYAQQLAKTESHNASSLLSLGDGTVTGIQGQHITAAALQGDVIACAAFAEVASWLAEGLYELTSILDPAAFVLGGGLGAAAEVLRAPLMLQLDKLWSARPTPHPDIRFATLGNDAGLIGAADLARTYL